MRNDTNDCWQYFFFGITCQRIKKNIKVVTHWSSVFKTVKELPHASIFFTSSWLLHFRNWYCEPDCRSLRSVRQFSYFLEIPDESKTQCFPCFTTLSKNLPLSTTPYLCSSWLHPSCATHVLSSVLHHPPVTMVQLSFSFLALYKPEDCLTQAVVLRHCIPQFIQYKPLNSLHNYIFSRLTLNFF